MLSSIIYCENICLASNDNMGCIVQVSIAEMMGTKTTGNEEKIILQYQKRQIWYSLASDGKMENLS